MKREDTNHERAVPSVHVAAPRSTRGHNWRTENRLQSILDATTEFYGTWNVSSGTFRFDERCLPALGYIAGEPPDPQLLLQRLMHADDQSTFEARLGAHLAGKTPILHCDVRLRTGTGRYRWFQLRGKVVQSDRRGATSDLAYAVRDIQEDKERQEEILASRELLMQILHASHDCISVVDPVEFRLTAFNKAFEELIFKAYGVRVRAGMRAEDLDLQQAEEWNAFCREVLASRSVARTYELPGLNSIHHVYAHTLEHAGHVDGLCIFAQDVTDREQAVGSAALIEVKNEACMLAVNMDITEQKRAIEALQESEERLSIAIEAGHMYAFEWDVATDVVERSKQSLRMLDLSEGRSTHSKQELMDRMLPEDRRQYKRAVESLKPEQPEYKAVFRLPLRDGRIAWLEESGRAIFGPDGKLRKVIGIVSDVTEVRESERSLRELSGRLITAQEEERRRIARELHDHIGQEAALICVQAQRLDSGVADEEHTTHSDVHELYRRIKGLACDVSRLSHRLHSSELSFLGLAVAAEHLCRDFAHEYGLDVDYQPKPLPQKLDTGKSLCLYRVLQEALQNVVKHSNASQVVVELKTVENELLLNVRDNGNGFDVNKAGSGLGLLSMRERLNFVGGRFAIASEPGSGTKVTANVAV